MHPFFHQSFSLFYLIMKYYIQNMKYRVMPLKIFQVFNFKNIWTHLSKNINFLMTWSHSHRPLVSKTIEPCRRTKEATHGHKRSTPCTHLFWCGLNFSIDFWCLKPSLHAALLSFITEKKISLSFIDSLIAFKMFFKKS